MPRLTRTITQILLAITIALAAVGAAGAALFATAGTALAPEPARLNATLYATGAASATYVYSSAPTNAVYLSGSYTPSSIPVGTPCSRSSPIVSGTVLTSVVVGSGSYRKCQ